MKITKAVIPVAGLATRFLPVTKSIPKEILPVGGLPIIHWVAKELIDAGVNKILFITNNRNRVIEQYFAHDPWLENTLTQYEKQHLLKEIDEVINKCNFFYTHQTKPQGIGDAILLAEDFVGEEPFFCHMGDSFFHREQICKKMAELHEKHNASCTIALKALPKERVMQKAHAITKEEVEKGVFSIQKIIAKPKEHELSGNFATIERFIFIPEIFEILRTLKQQDAITYKNHFGKMINGLFPFGPGLGLEVSPDTPFYDAADLKSYYKTLIQFLENEQER